MIEIDRETLRDFERASRLEWLETDGLGGWAGSTLAGAHSRRDHHLLRLPAGAAAATAATAAVTAAGKTAPKPASSTAASSGATVDLAAAGGTVALSKLDELVIEGGRVHELSCNRFPFFVAAAGVRQLAGFRRDLFPTFEYEAAGIRLQKTVALLEGDGALVVVYEVLEAPGPFVLALRPFLARRAPHALCRADRHDSAPEAVREAAGLRLSWSSGAQILLAAKAELDHRPDWWYRFELEEERRHGVDYQEDLWTPGLLRRELQAGDRFGVVASAAGAADRDPLELLARERRRREKLLDRLPVKDELTRILALAADQFPLRPFGGARLLAAGYPGPEGPEGHGDAAADSLIALPGVLLATGRADEAKKLLRASARTAVSGAGAPDDGLWLFVAAWRYLQATGDEDLLRDALVPALGKIAAAYASAAATATAKAPAKAKAEAADPVPAGSASLDAAAPAEPANADSADAAAAPAGLRAAEDGLLEAVPGSPAAARRPGKAVEINALWHNALATLADLSGRLGNAAEAKLWGERARRAQRRYAELFWNAAQGCLYDSVDSSGADPALRAHQVLAIGLPFPALSKQRGQRLLRTIEERLFTPVGLRDLAVAGEGAVERSDGRDGGGHDGGAHPGRAGRSDLAWPWLLGPLLAAQVWLRGAAGRRQALHLVAELDPLLSSCVVGTIPELITVEPPHAAMGHAAHAASVGEALRVYVDDLHPASTPPPPAPRRRPSKPKPKPKPAGGKAGPRRGRGRQGGPGLPA
jgi:glycogen debranching enzyme